MDGGTFDRLTRLLAGRLTRRTGLVASLGALAAGAGSAPALEARRRDRDRDRDRRRPDRGAGLADSAEVIDEKKPCGPKARDNRCRKHKQCCTKYCRKPKGGQKYGRCRCVKPGKKCKNGQTCCGGALCQNKTCTIQPVGPTCSATGGSCASDANCCSGLVCNSGVCGACVETVCASGCPFTTVNAAYAAATAGSTIYIGAGTYPTGIVITKDITLAACPGVAGAKLVPDRQTKVPDMNDGDYYAIAWEDSVDTTTLRTVKLRNLALEATSVASPDEALLFSAKYETVSFQLANCSVKNATRGIWAGTGSHEAIDCQFDGYGDGIKAVYNNSTRAMSLVATRTSFSNGLDSTRTTYHAIELDSSNSVSGSVTITDCTFADGKDYAMDIVGDSYNLDKHVASITNTSVVRNARSMAFTGFTVGLTGCTIENNRDTGIDGTDVLLTLTNTSVKNNTAIYYGGGVYVGSEYANSSLTIVGSTMITGNDATAGTRGGGGIMRYQALPKTVTVTGTTTSNVTGNIPDNCALWPDPPDVATTVSCSTWT